MSDSETISLAKDLISRQSVTPEDAGCQEVMIERLSALGFNIERMRFDDVDNFWARRGDAEPVLAFAGHTDVVPTGPLEEWHTDPFEPVIKDGLLYGRGAADMKGSLAAMITAIESFIAEHSDHKGSIALLITSDEEGPSINGTVKVIEALEQRGEKITYTLVGEPSSTTEVGDIIKNGRRGSINGVLHIHGTQGHVAYPHLANNPVHLAGPVITALANEHWDDGNDHFPPTSFQISNIHSGTGATNVIPGDIDITFNFRFSTELTPDVIKERVTAMVASHDVDFDIDWNLSGMPFLTADGQLVSAASDAIKTVTGRETTLSTSGGTSDGRFIAPTGSEVVELGPLNATIHKVNECVSCDDLDTLSAIYTQMMVNLLGK